jgi:hypothetical protein
VSCFFRIDDQDVWNPSNSVGKLFLATSEAIQVEFGPPSGMGEIIDDECEVDGDTFTDFVTALLARYETSNNRALRFLLEGVIAIGLVMLDRAGRPITVVHPDYEEFWRQRRESVARGMPRG